MTDLHAQLHEARVYIDNHAFEAITMEQVAETVGISFSYFSTTFKVAHGITPKRYQMQARIDYAKRLLRDTEMAPGDIGLHVGFSDQAHFGKVFKLLEGISPLRYRRKALDAEGAVA